MRYTLFFCLIVWAVVSCQHVQVYEKHVDLPAHEWRKNQNAVVPFQITDSVDHQLYLVVRHTEQFAFNRLLVHLLIQDSVKKTITALKINAPLTDSLGNWAGLPMDDLWYTRIRVQPRIFLKPGRYRFVLQQRMKEDTLFNLLNVGVALDK
ncbi:gliding motility lipoprotein GldH [Niabella insulamsoli]|uniref:gliding motility lipoprotein GldH n=1 Tax=Niabella insulamsoli TaxID=3144874 RepID=UPI0031FD318F